jgi:tRNA(adenine34) deaminase
MKEAFKEAQKAYKKDEVPVGAVIVKDGKIIARGYNQKEKCKNAIKHAEIIAIEKACKKLKNWHLEGCELYVTLEPCLMCAGAIFQSRIKRVVYAASEPKFGSFGSVINVSNPEYKFNHKIELTKGVLEEESALLLKTFFKEIRTKKQS